MSWSTSPTNITIYIYLARLALGVRQWVHPDGDKGFEETVSNRRKPYGGQPILQILQIPILQYFNTTIQSNTIQWVIVGSHMGDSQYFKVSPVVASEKEFGAGPILDTIYRYSGIWSEILAKLKVFRLGFSKYETWKRVVVVAAGIEIGEVRILLTLSSPIFPSSQTASGCFKQSLTVRKSQMFQAISHSGEKPNGSSILSQWRKAKWNPYLQIPPKCSSCISAASAAGMRIAKKEPHIACYSALWIVDQL